MKKSISTAAILTAAALALAGCASNEAGTNTPASGGQSSAAASVSGTFNAGGASSQEAAQASWIAEFQNANNAVTINYNPIGSGSGRKQFFEGATVFAGSDSALKDEELSGSFASCAAGTKGIDLPVYISPIAVVFNVEGVDALNLDAVTIAKIFKGEITSWDDPAIAAMNPDAKLPKAPITVVHRSDDSGTTNNFTDYLKQNAPEVWDKDKSDKFPYSFAGAEGAQGTSGVISSVSGGKNTIGYADASKAKGLSTVALKVGDGFEAVSAESSAAVVEASPRVDGREAGDFAIKLNRTTTEAGHYPLVLVSYLIVCQDYAEDSDADFVRAYAKYVASEEGQQAAATGAGSAPLSAATREAVQAIVDTIK